MNRVVAGICVAAAALTAGCGDKVKSGDIRPAAGTTVDTRLQPISTGGSSPSQTGAGSQGGVKLDK